MEKLQEHSFRAWTLRQMLLEVREWREPSTKRETSAVKWRWVGDFGEREGRVECGGAWPAAREACGQQVDHLHSSDDVALRWKAQQSTTES